ncbi:MAG: hypothetical protein H7256_10265 [Bdellovibrio sp.]|nr:hypothetical protein [Bdellovibrio sp.]
MKLKILAVIAFTIFTTSCTKTENKNITKALNDEIGEKVRIATYVKDVDSFLGKNPSKLKETLMDHLIDQTQIKYSDIKIDGNKATVKVEIESPNKEKIGNFIFMGTLMPQEKVLKMSFKELVETIKKENGVPASEAEFKSLKYVTIVNLEKNGTWIPNPSDINHLYDKKI